MGGSMPESKIAMSVPLAEVGGSRQPSPIEAEVLHLFDLWRNRLLRYLLGFSLTPADSEEIIQEVFLALFQHLRAGKSRENLHAWLFRVAHNLALRKRRDDRRDLDYISGAPIQAESIAPDPAPNPEDQFAAHQTRERLLAVVSALPETDRRCLTLRAEGLRYREIARVLDLSLSTVSASLSRSLARISRAAQR